nr:EF-Tu/IF-2/RF-3 family GTPase [uncultured Vagococcus sp.]
MMPIKDISTITRRGTASTGCVERGVVRSGDEVEIVRFVEEPLKITVTSMEMFHKELDYAEASDNIGSTLS